MVYQHAARFAERGHTVLIVMPQRMQAGIAGWARHMAVQARDRLHRVQPTPYYQAGGVESLVVPTLSPQYVPHGDVIIATGFQTAQGVSALPPCHGSKVYYLQGLETFVHPEARKSWHYPMALVPCAHWLATEVEREGLTVHGVVPNAIDPEEFYQTVPPEARGLRLAALYHRHSVKGPDVLIAALNHVRTRLPTVEAEIFAARPPSHELPRWVQVHVRPSLDEVRSLYNRAAVLLHPSRSEGWGLVPMEAAACGVAIASSANPGIAEFLDDGTSVRCVPVGDGVALGDAALDLLRDPEIRISQALAGQRAVASFDMGAQSAHFLDLLASL